MHEAILEFFGPPSSPPNLILLIARNTMHDRARQQKTNTLKPSEAAGTKYPSYTKSGPLTPVVPPYLLDSYIVAITHGIPSPKNTFTEFDPVTLPIAASASSSYLAAVILAKVSGREVPKATKVMAVIDGGTIRTHPKSVANLSTIAVTKPIMARAPKKQAHPLHIWAGGTNEKRSFHPMQLKCMKPSMASKSSIFPSSFFYW